VEGSEFDDALTISQFRSSTDVRISPMANDAINPNIPGVAPISRRRRIV